MNDPIRIYPSCENYRIDTSILYSDHEEYQEAIMTLFNMQGCFDDHLFKEGFAFLKDKMEHNTDIESLCTFAGEKLLFNPDFETGLVVLHCYELLADFHSLVSKYIKNSLLSIGDMEEYKKLRDKIEDMSGPADPGIS